MMSPIHPIGQTLCSYPAFSLAVFENALNKCQNVLFQRTLSTDHSERVTHCITSSLFNDILSDESLSEKVANATLEVIHPRNGRGGMTVALSSQAQCPDFLKYFNGAIENVKKTIPITDKIVHAVSSFFQTTIYDLHHSESYLMKSHVQSLYPAAPCPASEIQASAEAVRIFSARQLLKDLGDNVRFACTIALVGIIAVATTVFIVGYLPPPAAAPAPAAAAPAPAAAAPLAPAAAPALITPTDPPPPNS